MHVLKILGVLIDLAISESHSRLIYESWDENRTKRAVMQLSFSIIHTVVALTKNWTVVVKISAFCANNSGYIGN